MRSSEPRLCVHQESAQNPKYRFLPPLQIITSPETEKGGVGGSMGDFFLKAAARTRLKNPQSFNVIQDSQAHLNITAFKTHRERLQIFV